MPPLNDTQERDLRRRLDLAQLRADARETRGDRSLVRRLECVRAELLRVSALLLRARADVRDDARGRAIDEALGRAGT